MISGAIAIRGVTCRATAYGPSIWRMIGESPEGIASSQSPTRIARNTSGGHSRRKSRFGERARSTLALMCGHLLLGRLRRDLQAAVGPQHELLELGIRDHLLLARPRERHVDQVCDPARPRGHHDHP